MGNALQQQGKLDEAIEAYNKTISIKPDYAEGFFNVGNVLQQQGKLEEAIEAYNQALSTNPTMLMPITTWGVLFMIKVS